MPLALTAGQQASLTTIDSNMQSAFSDGTTPPVLAPIDGYAKLDADMQKLTKDTFKLALAAYMAAMGMPGLTTVINYTKQDMSPGTLTFTNGILTAST